jgi:hypothetical protein
MSLEVLDWLVVVEVRMEVLMRSDVIKIVDMIIDAEDIEVVLIESLAVVLLVIWCVDVVKVVEEEVELGFVVVFDVKSLNRDVDEIEVIEEVEVGVSVVIVVGVDILLVLVMEVVEAEIIEVVE